MSCKHKLASLAIFACLFSSCGTETSSAVQSNEVENLTAKVDDLIKKKDYKKAEALVTPLIKNGEQQAEAYCALGNIYISKGDTAVALYSFYKSIEADSTYENPYVCASEILNQKGQSFDAISILRVALEKNPKSSVLMNALGCAYDAHGNDGDAMEAFKSAYELDKTNLIPIRNLGIKYLVNNEFYEAVECFEIASELAPNDPKLCNYLALAYARNNNFEQAETYFKRAIALDNNYVEAYFNLGYLYEEHNDLYFAKLNYERAAKLGDAPSELRLKQVRFKNAKKKN